MCYLDSLFFEEQLRVDQLQGRRVKVNRFIMLALLGSVLISAGVWGGEASSFHDFAHVGDGSGIRTCWSIKTPSR